MDLTSRTVIKNLLKNQGIRPLKHFGQNFLVDKGVLEKIIKAADLQSKDIVLEIGPGIGNLTQALAKKAKKVIAVEKDRHMVEVLKKTMKDFNNVEIIEADILKWSIKQERLYPKYKIIANLPFYLTSPVIRKFLESSKVQPYLMVLMIQKEVGQRICARPPRMNLLAASVQFYGTPEIISYISKKSFWPQPKVDSAIIKITPKPSLVGERDLFFQIVKAGFSQPRKQLINNLSKGLKIDRIKAERWLLGNNIQPTQRAETLTIKDWIKLTKNYKTK